MIEREGATVELSCEATGIPAPTLTWLKDDKELGRSARVTLSPNGRVIIKSIVVRDAGVYTCLFKNPVAQVSHDIRVVVKGQSRASLSLRTVAPHNHRLLTRLLEMSPTTLTSTLLFSLLTLIHLRIHVISFISGNKAHRKKEKRQTEKNRTHIQLRI